MWTMILNALVKQLETNPAIIGQILTLFQTIADAIKSNPDIAKEVIAAFAPKP
jgi:hypothetical protein